MRKIQTKLIIKALANWNFDPTNMVTMNFRHLTGYIYDKCLTVYEVRVFHIDVCRPASCFDGDDEIRLLGS